MRKWNLLLAPHCPHPPRAGDLARSAVRGAASRPLILAAVLLCAIAPQICWAQTAFPGLWTVTLGSGSWVQCAANTGSAYPNPVWDARGSGLVTYPSPAIRNGSITASFLFHSSSAYQDYNGTFSFSMLWWNGGSVAYTPSTQTLSVPHNRTGSVSVTVGPFANYVNPHKTLLFVYRLSDPNNPGNFYQSGAAMEVYLIHKNPTTPMSTPWVGVLDDSCAWAQGDSTDATVARDETLSLFIDPVFVYTGGSQWTDPPGGITFLLARFLAAQRPVLGNCIDVSDYLQIVTAAQGLGFIVEQITDANTRAFSTNPICPIGSQYYNPGSYVPFNRVFHQVCISGSGTVYDACEAQRVDLQGNSYQEPPYDWNLYGYWQTPQSPPPIPPPTFGLVATPNPSILGTIITYSPSVR